MNKSPNPAESFEGALPPMRILQVINHDDAVVLPAATSDGRAIITTVTRMKSVMDLADAATEHDLLVVDWAGACTPPEIDLLRARCIDTLVLVLGDGDDDEDGLCQPGGASEWIARKEVTPYWLDRTLRRYALHVAVGPLRQLEMTLAESEAHFRAVLDAMPIMLARLDKELRYRWIHSALPMVDVQSLLGKRMGETNPSVATERLISWGQEVMRTGKGMRALNNLPMPDGEMTFDTTIEPVLDAAGAATGVTFAALDVTPTHRLQKALLASERRYRTLVESTSVGVFCMDARTGEVLERAPKWEGYSGQEWPHYQHGGWAEAIHPEEREQVKTVIAAALRTQEPQRAEARVLNSGTQEWRWCEVRIVPVRNDGEVVEWVCFLRDVHDRRVAEQQVERHAQELETVLDLLPMAVFFAHDPRAEFITTNRRGAELMRCAAGIQRFVECRRGSAPGAFLSAHGRPARRNARIAHAKSRAQRCRGARR